MENDEITRLVNPNKTIYQTICGLYTFLEMLGYLSDRRLKKEERFLAFQSDQLHVANAAFTKAVFTRDKPLAMKAGAIYEYLGIGTNIVYIDIS
jgi:hypothetical protein